MTDKFQKIREEVEKLKSQLIRGACSSQVAMETRCKKEAYNDVLAILDTTQEEHIIEEAPSDDYVKGFADGRLYQQRQKPSTSVWHDASEPPIIDKTFLLVAPNGNSSLCLCGGKQLHSVTIGGGHSVLCKGDIYSYIDDLLNLSNVQRTVKNWKEPVSEELEEAGKQYLERSNPDRVHQITNAFKAGAQWQKEKEYTCYEEAFEDGATWKKEKIMETLLSEVLPCFMHGGEADEVVAKLDEVLNKRNKL